MTSQQIQDKMFRSVARSMEAEGANFERVLKLMRERAAKRNQK